VPTIEPELPSGYAGMLVSLKELVTSAQLRAQEAASNAMVAMYWEIGSTILQRQAAQPWGTKILQRLAADLKSAFPHMRGFSRSNLFYMYVRLAPAGGTGRAAIPGGDHCGTRTGLGGGL
jgi:hypothetical protein